MRSGRDPTRRNRKRGTPDFAWKDRPGVPWPFDVPSPREAVWGRAPRSGERREVNGHVVTVAVERLRDGWEHPCTASDVFAVLAQLPTTDLEGVALVVLHQPSRKQTC